MVHGGHAVRPFPEMANCIPHCAQPNEFNMKPERSGHRFTCGVCKCIFDGGFLYSNFSSFFTPKDQLAIQLCTLITNACKLWLDWYWGQDNFQCCELCITVYLLYWPLWHKNRAPRVSAFMSMRILEGLCVVKKTQYLIPIYKIMRLSFGLEM